MSVNPPGQPHFLWSESPSPKYFLKITKQRIDTLISQSLLYTQNLSNIWPALPIKWRVSQRWSVCFGLTRISLSRCLLWRFLLFPQWLRYPHHSGSISLLWPLYQTPKEPNLIPWSFLLSRVYDHSLSHLPFSPTTWLLHTFLVVLFSSIQRLWLNTDVREQRRCAADRHQSSSWCSCRQAQNHFETEELEKLK